MFSATTSSGNVNLATLLADFSAFHLTVLQTRATIRQQRESIRQQRDAEELKQRVRKLEEEKE